ncbi:MAG: Lrp/AsnC family transcriptional regulator [Bacteroides sp.]|nr:Lrp/AsnC family transcriptional regulator [Bacteroides sp.]MCM1548915.1 Lrp/AsnC family transcriptional regulator [Clostridium sp.]
MRTRILNLVEENCKLTAKDIAAMLGEDEEAVTAELKAMEQEHIICGYTSIIDWDKTESEFVTALIELKVTPQRGEGFDKIAERISNYPEVDTVYLMSGGYDFAVIIKGKTMKEVSLFVSGKLAPMEAVVGTATHFVLKKYKEHGVRLTNNTKAERLAIMP